MVKQSRHQLFQNRTIITLKASIRTLGLHRLRDTRARILANLEIGPSFPNFQRTTGAAHPPTMKGLKEFINSLRNVIEQDINTWLIAIFPYRITLGAV